MRLVVPLLSVFLPLSARSLELTYFFSSFTTLVWGGGGQWYYRVIKPNSGWGIVPLLPITLWFSLKQKWYFASELITTISTSSWGRKRQKHGWRHNTKTSKTLILIFDHTRLKESLHIRNFILRAQITWPAEIVVNSDISAHFSAITTFSRS